MNLFLFLPGPSEQFNCCESFESVLLYQIRGGLTIRSGRISPHRFFADYRSAHRLNPSKNQSEPPAFVCIRKQAKKRTDASRPLPPRPHPPQIIVPKQSSQTWLPELTTDVSYSNKSPHLPQALKPLSPESHTPHKYLHAYIPPVQNRL